eukprot:COSAG03_NODE_1382_length_4196_cov_14.516837_4_plen_282_part_00
MQCGCGRCVSWRRVTGVGGRGTRTPHEYPPTRSPGDFDGGGAPLEQHSEPRRPPAPWSGRRFAHGSPGPGLPPPPASHLTGAPQSTDWAPPAADTTPSRGSENCALIDWRNTPPAVVGGGASKRVLRRCTSGRASRGRGPAGRAAGAPLLATAVRRSRCARARGRDEAEQAWCSARAEPLRGREVARAVSQQWRSGAVVPMAQLGRLSALGRHLSQHKGPHDSLIVGKYLYSSVCLCLRVSLSRCLCLCVCLCLRVCLCLSSRAHAVQHPLTRLSALRTAQ